VFIVASLTCVHLCLANVIGSSIGCTVRLCLPYWEEFT
jgi:hypothetical protein